MHFNYHFFSKIFILNLTAIWLFMLPCLNPAAFAHKVIIFAWVDGDTIHTQSKFSGGKKAMNTDILVYNTSNVLLLKGKTDKKGEFSFKIPAKTDLRIVSNASMGHKAEWKISSAEMTSDLISAKEISDQTSQKLALDQPESSGDNVNYIYDSSLKQEIRNIIEESLNKKLDPVIKMLAESYSGEPEVKDIIGGIGYIVGLVGVALYFVNRKKDKK